ncbi:MAG: 4Fe-4S double cluster binding domain-containing protein [Eubacteriales bacterium]
MKTSVASVGYPKGMAEDYGCIIDHELFLQQIKSWGATLVGVGDVREGLVREFRHLPVAISLAIAHPPVKECIVTKDFVAAYTNQFPVIDARLENIQKRMISFLRSVGWKAFEIPPDSDKQDPRFVARLFHLFPHKTAATCSGLGWVGKNGLLVTKEYGARLSWATVLTDAPLKVSTDPYLEGQCNSCNRCVGVCPAKAISSEEWVRGSIGQTKIKAKACARQLKKNYETVGSYICGLCITACPLSRR